MLDVEHNPSSGASRHLLPQGEKGSTPSAKDIAFQPGDVGLVEVSLAMDDGSTDPRVLLFGAIRTGGDRWAVKAAGGLCVGPLAIVAAWRLPGAVSDTRLALLAGFLRSASEAAFQFGEWDCGMTVANWVQQAIGRDPGAALRGKYASRPGWTRVVRRAGGMEALYDRALGDAGLARIV